MSVKIRLSRGGSKKRPFYKVVAADSRAPRDGKFIEKLGTHNPMLPKDHADRTKLNEERIKHWLGQGAQPSDRVAKMLGQAGIIAMPTYNETPTKSKPGAKMTDRAEQKAAKLAEAEEAKNAPKEEEAQAEDAA